ncbi:hypothetical protein HHJ81_06360 [Mobiluncus mulieris]|uniref:DUF6541 family protein n=1 Tax=Mobiluncus mulieris TaxID=2052 RepID=UPI00146FE65D|nr:DUF6541 family protein [Mobiluncus mulieris]NMW60711.1 hypothetical protein [Mobiluncus mulieris]
MVSFLIAVVALAVFLVLPGTLLMLALGLRPLPAAALGAPATVGILAVAAQILSCLHVPWNLATAVVSGLLLGIILLLGLRWRHIFRREVLASLYSKVRNGEQGQTWFHRPESSASNQSAAPRWIFLPSMLGAFLMAGFFQLWPFLSQLGDYSAPAQLFDSMFHYSGIRYIADTGDAGWIGSLDGVYGSNFHHVYYPNQWHLLAALFVPWASVTLIANALFFALVAVCFPLGVALLAEYAWGRHSGAIPLAVLLSPATLVFPYYIGLLQNLYPYVLATIWWLPLAWVVLKSGDAFVQNTWRQPGKIAVSCLVFLAALQAHPSIFGFVSMLVFLSCFSFAVTGRFNRKWLGWALTFGLLLVGLAAATVLSRHGFLRKAHLSDDDTSWYRAVGSALHISQLYASPWWALTPLFLVMFLGLLVHAITKGDWRFLGWWLAVGVLVLATKLNLGLLKVITGLWYGAHDRIASGAVAILPVFAAGGILWITQAAGGAFSRIRQRAEDSFRPTQVLTTNYDRGVSLGVVLLLVITTATYIPYAWQNRRDLAMISYIPGKQFHAPWVSEAEFAAQGKLHLGKRSLVIGDPSSGAGLLYARANIPVVYPSLADTARGPQEEWLAIHFNEIHTNPEVCQLVRELGVTHFYDDATGAAAHDFQFPGFHDVDVSRGFTEVARADQARVYRIEACRNH